MSMLFAIRAVLVSDVGRYLVQRGNGAEYINPESLRSLLIPIGLSQTYSLLFRIFAQAVAQYDSDKMALVERLLRKRLQLRVERRIGVQAANSEYFEVERRVTNERYNMAEG
jgi:hypothetical protein